MALLQRWSAKMDSAPAGFRLGLAWLLCFVPRAVAAWRLGPIGGYRHFADPSVQPEAFWYPAYVALARAFWAASFGSVTLHVAWHVALHAIIGPLVYAICRRAGLGETVGWISVLGVALLPYYVSLAARQPQVGAVISFVALVVLAFLWWRDSDFRWPAGVIFAVLGFVSALLRPNFLLSMAALYAVALTLLRTSGRHVASAARAAASLRILASGAALACLMGALAGFSLWRTGHPSPFPPVTGYNLYLGHNERVNEYLHRYDILSLEDINRDHGLPPEAARQGDLHERDRILYRFGMDYIRENPRETFINVLWKSVRYWDIRLEDADDNPTLWNLAFTGPYLVYGTLALFGAFWMLRDGRGVVLAVLAALLLSYWLPHLVFFPTIRMRMTTEFALVVLAAYAAARWLGEVPEPSGPNGSRRDSGGGQALP
jgi:hypothetical protein